MDWVSLTLIFARCLGCVLCIPWGDAVTTMPRTIIAGACAVALATKGVSHEPEWSPTLWMVPLEFSLGCAIALPFRAVIEMVALVGETADAVRGQLVSAATDPLNAQIGSDLATLTKTAALVLSLQLGALEALLDTLFATFQMIPAVSFDRLQPLWNAALRNAGDTFVKGLAFCAFWAGPSVALDAICALANRLFRAIPFSTMNYLLRTAMTLAVAALVAADVCAHPARWFVPFDSARAWVAESSSVDPHR